jgi:uroporphyrinogen-III synthase
MNEETLRGIDVALTRPIDRNEQLARLLGRLGARVVEVPLIEIGPPSDQGEGLRSALDHIEELEWIAVLSTNGARALLQALNGVGLPRSCRVAAVGQATADALGEGGLEVTLVGDGSGGAALAGQISEAVDPAQLLVVAAQEGRQELAEELGAVGWRVTSVAGYATVATEVTKQDRASLLDADVVVVASPSAVGSFRALGPSPDQDQSFVAIGETTAAALREAGLAEVIVAEAPTDVALAEAVVRAVQQRS